MTSRILPFTKVVNIYNLQTFYRDNFKLIHIISNISEKYKRNCIFNYILPDSPTTFDIESHLPPLWLASSSHFHYLCHTKT